MIFIIIGVVLGFLVGLLSNTSIQKLEEPTRSSVLIVLGFPGMTLFEKFSILTYRTELS